MFKFENPLPVVYGLAFDVDASDRPSGLKPAERDLGANKPLFGHIRLIGFASLLMTHFAEKLIIVGGHERRFEPTVPRGEAICRMLEMDCGIPRDRLGFLVSGANTLGNVAMIREHASGSPIVAVSNHYHLPRAALDFDEQGITATLHAAESFILIRDPSDKQWLCDEFGSGDYAQRVAEEIQGMADKLKGTYASRTKN